MAPLRRVFWGYLFIVMDVHTLPDIYDALPYVYDFLPDIFGYFLVIFALRRLSAYHRRFKNAFGLAIVGLVLSVFVNTFFGETMLHATAALAILLPVITSNILNGTTEIADELQEQNQLKHGRLMFTLIVLSSILSVVYYFCWRAYAFCVLELIVSLIAFLSTFSFLRSAADTLDGRTLTRHD